MLWNADRRSSGLRVLALIGALLVPAAASAEEPAPAAQLQRGQRLFLYCAACHTLQAGQPNKVGPNLAGVVGAAAGTRGTYPYSEALRKSGIVWTDESLNAWLTQPAHLVPGTKMAFVGLPNEADRKAVIAYLHASAH
jgi:cytochrome c